MKHFSLALSFLTTLPIKGTEKYRPEDLGNAVGWFPAVGALIGGLLMIAAWLIQRWFPALVSAAIITALWILLTGGLHLDGLADCCDGLLVSASSKRRLEILRDPRVGAFGAIGIGLFLILKTSALAALPDLRALLLAPVIGRWILAIGALQPSARKDGLGAAFKVGLTRSGLAFAAAITALIAGLCGWRGLLAFLMAHLIGWGVFSLARRRIGGMTGDVLGASCELCELIVLLSFVLKVG